MTKTPETTAQAAKRLLRTVKRTDAGGLHQGKNIVEAASLLVDLTTALEETRALVDSLLQQGTRSPAATAALAEQARRLSALEERLAHVDTTATRAALHSVPFGSVKPHETVVPRYDPPTAEVPPRAGVWRGLD